MAKTFIFHTFRGSWYIYIWIINDLLCIIHDTKSHYIWDSQWFLIYKSHCLPSPINRNPSKKTHNLGVRSPCHQVTGDVTGEGALEAEDPNRHGESKRSQNGGFPQQPWVFLLKMIILGWRLGVPLFLETPSRFPDKFKFCDRFWDQCIFVNVCRSCPGFFFLINDIYGWLF